MTERTDAQPARMPLRPPRPAATAVARPNTGKAPPRNWKSWWLRQVQTWHWVSAALCLLGMLLFSVTGITLNHAADIPATPKVTEKAGQLPAALLPLLRTPASDAAPLPPAVATAVRAAVGLDPSNVKAEWSDGEVYVALPRAGGDAWVTVDRGTGAIGSERTDRGWVSYLNDLHKGRNTGPAWFWFIDIFAAACILFTVTGLLLLQLHAWRRKSTWPVVGLGVIVPLLLIIFLVH